MKQPLTLKQKGLLEFILAFKNEKGYYPTIKEMAIGTGRTNLPVWEMLMRLDKAGAIRHTKAGKRNIKIVRGKDVEGLE